MSKKEPLYPHKTPSEMAREQKKPVPQQPAWLIHIIKQGSAMAEADSEPWYFPQDTVYPVPYTEVLAGPDDKSYGATHITYDLYPTLKLGYVEMVGVESKYRRQGLGKKLVGFAIDEMKKHGITKVSAGLISQEGLLLFESMGFTITENTGKDVDFVDLEPYVAVKYL